MGLYPLNVYEEPQAFGLTQVAEIDLNRFEPLPFVVAVWKDEAERLYFAIDAKNFEAITIEEVMPLDDMQVFRGIVRDLDSAFGFEENSQVPAFFRKVNQASRKE